jgi:2-methylcitrate dehydratase PrpD
VGSITTEAIARFIVDAEYNDLTQEAIKTSKKGVLDWLGVSIAGAREIPALIVSEQVRQMGASGNASVISRGFKTATDLAAWVNGISGHTLDYDDTFPADIGWNFHPTVPVLPAVMALAEQLGATGKELLISYAVGVQVEFWIGNLIGRRNTDLGWHTLSTLGTLGSIAASAKVLRLDVPETARAFGIGSTFAGGLRSNLGTMSKSLQAGNAARAGVVAASLASKGFTGKETIIEEKLGFLDIFSGGATDPFNMIGDLQMEWAIDRPGIAFKPYPCCRATHTSIDAALTLKKQNRIDVGKITKIICRTSPFNRQFARSDRPGSGYEAKFSIPYCIAVSLLRGRVVLEDFSDQAHGDPNAQALLTLIEVLNSDRTQDQGLDLSSEIEITMQDGTNYTCRVDAPKGEPGNQLSAEELSAKLDDCASRFLKAEEIQRLQETVSSLESVRDLSVLMQIAINKQVL